MPILLLYCIEIIFATKCTICILCTSDVQCSQEQYIIDFNKCCSCESTLQIYHNFFIRDDMAISAAECEAVNSLANLGSYSPTQIADTSG